MHSHDRTLLASLGFADPDKKDRQHDGACRYMALPESFDKMINTFMIARLDKADIREMHLTEHHIDHHIVKGEGKYAATVGFADVYLTGTGVQDSTWTPMGGVQLCDSACRVGCEGGKLHLSTCPAKMNALVEVKIGRVSAGDLIRQLGLYRAYLPAQLTVVACAFSLTRAEVDSLANEKIHYVRLGKSFDDYMATAREDVVDEDLDF